MSKIQKNLEFSTILKFLIGSSKILPTSKTATLAHLGAPLQSEKWPHGEKMSIFQSLLYFHHNVTTGKETSY